MEGQQNANPPPVQAGPHVETTHRNINKIDFMPERADLFFDLLEIQFDRMHITDELDRFGILVGMIPPPHFPEAASLLVRTIPHDLPYTKLKDVVLACFLPTDYRQIRARLRNEKLGVDKPSDFLARLQRIAFPPGSAVNEVMVAEVRDLWQSQMPEFWRATLTSLAEVNDAAKVADQLYLCQVYPGTSSVAALNFTPPALPISFQQEPQTAALRFSRSAEDETGKRLSKVEDQIVQINRRLDGISSLLSNNNGRTYAKNNSENFRSRGRSPSRPRSVKRDMKNGVCWYHEQYGMDAKKCEPECRHHAGFLAYSTASSKVASNSKDRPQ
jgi:hypothetical protein